VPGSDRAQKAGFVPGSRASCFLAIYSVCYTKFEGPVPSSLSNISVLQQLILHGNRFHGRIPPNIGVHGSLTDLELGNNQLQAVDTKDWDFLTPLVNCSHLKYLNLELNNISGILPNAVSNLSYELEWLMMGGNKITGTVPSGIGRLQKLKVLDLSAVAEPEIFRSLGNFKRSYDVKK
jgi:Leucine-rich repeat (LRR) protein